MRIGGERNAQHPHGAQGDSAGDHSCGDYGSQADDDSAKETATIAESENTTVERTDVGERRGRTRHNLRYSKGGGYLEAMAYRSGQRASTGPDRWKCPELALVILVRRFASHLMMRTTMQRLGLIGCEEVKDELKSHFMRRGDLRES
jgi:hypothetical protein